MDWVKAAPPAVGGGQAFQVYAGFLAEGSLAESLVLEQRNSGMAEGGEGSYAGARSLADSIFRCSGHNTKGQVFLLPIFRYEVSLALAGGLEETELGFNLK